MLKHRTILKTDFEGVLNPALKARYSHVLWCTAETKHGNYARAAVDAYLELSRILEQKERQNSSGFFGFHLLCALQNAASLAYQCKYRLEKVLSDCGNLIVSLDFANPASFNLRRGLMGFLLERKRQNDNSSFIGFEDVCWKVYQDLLASGKVEAALEAIELGEKVEKRLGLKTREWVTERAECYEKLMNVYHNTPNELMYCQDALQVYKEAKQCAKTRELEEKGLSNESSYPNDNIHRRS